MIAAIISICLRQISLVDPSPRDLLEKMIESRRTFATADLRWTQTTSLGAGTEHRRSQFDGTSWTFVRVGDSDGVVQSGRIGEPGSCSEDRYLHTIDGVWNVHEQNALAVFFKNGRPPAITDGRTLGIMPENVVTDLPDLLRSVVGNVKDDALTAKDEGSGVWSVSADTGRSTINWWLDSRRGYNPVRIERHSNGEGKKLLSETHVDLAQYDGRWFPKLVVQTRFPPSGQPSERIDYRFEFTSVEFDRPDHPATLIPAGIGVMPYYSVSVPGEPGGPFLWTGSELINFSEFLKREKAKLITQKDTDPWRERMAWCHDHPGRWPAWMSEPSYACKATDIDEWEKYVRRFCLIRKCDDRQKASAKGILDDCRKTAVPMLAKIQEAQAKEKDAARKEAMLAPISDIFTKSLVPRLEALLTTPQSQPSSQPAVISKAPSKL